MQPAQSPLVVVLMGVSGCGKSTTGARLSKVLGWPFRDADTFHPPANIEKMSRGVPLADADRWPWLNAIHDLISNTLAQGKHAVVACSALRKSYRDCLRQPGVRFVYLKGAYTLFHERLKDRRQHFRGNARTAIRDAQRPPGCRRLRGRPRRLIQQPHRIVLRK